MQTGRRMIGGSACLALAVVVFGGWLVTAATGHGHRAYAAHAGGHCILCNAFGADKAPRICNSCNNKFNNRCILCNAFGADKLPRICTSCNNKH